MVAVEVVVEVFGMLVLPGGLFMRMFSTTAIINVSVFIRMQAWILDLMTVSCSFGFWLLVLACGAPSAWKLERALHCASAAPQR